MENEDRSENVKAGQARAQGAGQGNWSTAREIGAATATQVRALRALGHGYQAIAQMVGTSRTTVRRMRKLPNLVVA
jgi:DNA invertase Pin-like site-specific DNA recombinase